MRKLAFLILLSSALMMNGCSTANPNAPTEIPHPLDDLYLDGNLHGPDAKQDLALCQACHGEPGGPGGNPRFNIGIDSAGGNGCESCHGVNYAHPQEWAGPNNTFHYSAGSVQEACTLCHGIDLDGIGGVGTSCLGCHDSVSELTLDCAFCHNYPPDGSLYFGTVNGVDHSAVPLENHFECTFCHGVRETASGGGFDQAPGYALFDKTSDTAGDHWDGNIQMTSEANYNDSTYGCMLAFCHASDTEATMSDSGLPVVLKNLF